MGRGAQSSGSPGGAQGARRRAPMPDNLEQAAEFHRQFKVDVQEAPCIPAESRTKLRLNLLQEELDELREAVATGNVVEVRREAEGPRARTAGLPGGTHAQRTNRWRTPSRTSSTS